MLLWMLACAAPTPEEGPAKGLVSIRPLQGSYGSFGLWRGLACWLGFLMGMTLPLRSSGAGEAGGKLCAAVGGAAV